MKKLVLVIGRSGSGKDTLVRYAQKVFNAASIPSYTDRPKRECETEGVEHTFLTPGQFDTIIANENVFAYTKIGETGYRYCTTVDMLNNMPSDIIFYIIDPKGYYYCKKFADKFDMKVVYVCADTDKRMERANSRNNDTVAWAKRCDDENAQFDEFEKSQDWDMFIENNGTPEEAEKAFTETLSNLFNYGGTYVCKQVY